MWLLRCLPLLSGVAIDGPELGTPNLGPEQGPLSSGSMGSIDKPGAKIGLIIYSSSQVSKYSLSG